MHQKIEKNKKRKKRQFYHKVKKKIAGINEEFFSPEFRRCDSFLKNNEIIPCLKRMVRGNEKWVIYKNFNRTIFWSNYGKPFIPHKTQFTSEEGFFMHLAT